MGIINVFNGKKRIIRMPLFYDINSRQIIESVFC